MSKLHSRLTRRKSRTISDATPDSTVAFKGSETARAEESNPGTCERSQVHGDDSDDELTVEDAPLPATEKSEIIAQLRKRMKKIETGPVHAFGTKNTRERWSRGEFEEATADVSISMQPDAQLSGQHYFEVSSATLPGMALKTSMGEVWLNRKTYPDYVMGNEPVNRYLKTGRALAAFARDERLLTLSPEGALFIDTETTGLSGGAGTLPFLIGVGFFEENVFVVEQYFCREPAEEPAQLEALAARMAKATYLVSFNGKSFDMPLVNTRFIINKTKNPAYNLPHLDLLHVSRRIFKRRLSDRSLQNLERVILGFSRTGDIPGAEIPAAYRDYLFGGDDKQMCAVLEHNLLDIVALAVLGGVLDKIYSDPAAVAHAADHLGLAKEAIGAGEADIAGSHLDSADVLGDADDKRIALHMKAKAALAAKSYFEAIEGYLRILDVDANDVDAHLQLAKLYEHRKKDYDKALYHAEKAEALEGAEGTAHRTSRIRKKKEKHAKRKW